MKGMRDLDVPTDLDDAARVAQCGEFMTSLLRDASWVVRREETITFIDHYRFRRSVTVQVDCSELRRRAEDIVGHTVTRVPLLLQSRPRALSNFRHVMVGELQTPTMASDTTRVAAAAIMATLHADRMPNLAQTIDVKPEFVSDVLEAIAPWPGSQYHPGAPTGEELAEAWGDPELCEDIEWLQANELAICTANVAGKRELTVAYELVGSRRGHDWPHGEGRRVFLFEPQHAGKAPREHISVVAPDGLFIESAELIRTPGPTPPPWFTDHNGPRLEPRYRAQIAPEQAWLYARNQSAEALTCLVSFLPRTSGTLVSSMVLALVLCGLGFASVVGGVFFDLFANAYDPDQPSLNIDGYVTIATAVPAAALAYAVRFDENPLVPQSMRRGRFALLAGGASTAVASMSLVMHGTPWLVLSLWGFATLASAVAVVVIGRIIHRSNATLRRVGIRQGESVEYALDSVADLDG